MTDYRRAFVPGATYFFTVNLADRRATLLVDHIDLLRDAIRYVRRHHPFDIDAMVVLPDHLHAILTLPSGDADFPLRWRLIKTWFSRHLPHGEHQRASRIDKGERGIWQRADWGNKGHSCGAPHDCPVHLTLTVTRCVFDIAPSCSLARIVRHIKLVHRKLLVDRYYSVPFLMKFLWNILHQRN